MNIGDDVEIINASFYTVFENYNKIYGKIVKISDDNKYGVITRNIPDIENIIYWFDKNELRGI